jgi:hypothetical protein
MLGRGVRELTARCRETVAMTKMRDRSAATTPAMPAKEKPRRHRMGATGTGFSEPAADDTSTNGASRPSGVMRHRAGIEETNRFRMLQADQLLTVVYVIAFRDI